MLKKVSKENLLSNKTKEFEYKQNELRKLKDEILEWNKKARKIQSKFNFVLPDYIIDEIIESETKKDYSNLHSLINCAVLNGKLSENNGNIIKQIYS